MTNAGSGATWVRFDVYDTSGPLVNTVQRYAPAKGTVSVRLDDRASFPFDFRGSAVVTGSQPLAASCSRCRLR